MKKESSQENYEILKKALESIATKAILDEKLDPDEILKICRKALTETEDK